MAKARRAPILLAAALASGLGIAEAGAQPLQRARAAEQRGDLRAAQIELRNAVRAEPQNAEARAILAAISLDLGDAETAEREARAAMDRGYDRVAATGLLLRTYLARSRYEELLNEFPMPPGNQPAALAGRIASGRALAQLGTDDKEAARASHPTARRRIFPPLPWRSRKATARRRKPPLTAPSRPTRLPPTR